MQMNVPPLPHKLAEFALETTPADIPPDVLARAADYVLDLLGVAAAATHLQASRIARETAMRMFSAASAADAAPILFDGRMASRAGAAYAGAMQIDGLDAHDGFSLAKGHAGCALLPGLAALQYGQEVSGRDFLASLVIGYELACRAGVALHDTTSDYHTSGAWVALAVAALGIRVAGGTAGQLREALGIAEYYGPRSQMMREIDNPTMLHDGSGWGAMVGVTAATLALSDFTGAPAVTVERDDAAAHWHTLGTQWLTLEQNIKLFPVCRWAHAPIHAALELKRAYGLKADDVAAIHIESFHEAVRLAQDIPPNTSKAQYSISYPVAAALKFGRLGVVEISEETFLDPDLHRLVAATTVSECDHCNQNFPADRLGRTSVVTRDGTRYDSGIVRAPGEHTAPILRDGLIEKFADLTQPVVDDAFAASVQACVFGLTDEAADCTGLEQLIYQAVQAR